MILDFAEVEKRWQERWEKEEVFVCKNGDKKEKYYVLDMFPYPSGSGLHVGHPLGYIASDIVSRYKRMQGYNVLHPMGFDALGLPAEQYAIQTGQHPAITTEQNIKTFKKQLRKIGLSYDWSREASTADPNYYRWTQWIFIQLYNSWYNKKSNRTEKIDTLIELFEKSGTNEVQAACDAEAESFSADDWKGFSEERKQALLLQYRLVYRADTTVNWCAELGCVLAHDEVINGFSERGGYPVEQKKMTQWMMRITAFADRLLEGLKELDWPSSVIEMQRNWIGKSIGVNVKFKLEDFEDYVETFTTRIDTIYGVSFVVIAPEHPWVEKLTKASEKNAVEEYIKATQKRSERERSAEVKKVSGVFTGSYVINPMDGTRVPIWIADYVLMGYGTGCVMAVPSGDQRDYDFAKKFNLPITQILDAQKAEDKADSTKEGKYINSGIINGLTYEEGVEKATSFLEEKGLGKRTIQFKMRDAVFGRQRYWGEPIPVFFKKDTPYLIQEQELPLVLPEIDKYLPTSDGQPPLARAENWKYQGSFDFEHTTMPGWAGSSWYWYRYMDAQNQNEFASKEAIDYWGQVDLYLGGDEHAVGHLLYSRFWNKALKDLGFAKHEEPFKKLVNQGKILGHSAFVLRLIKEEKAADEPDVIISYGLKDNYTAEEVSLLHVPIEMLGENNELDREALLKFRPDLKEAQWILEDRKCFCGRGDEKMSKSKYNVVNPDELIEKYGADTFRMYEMFLGPLELPKPWNTQGIEGVNKFLKKMLRLFYDGSTFLVEDVEPTKEENRTLHKTIKKIRENLDRLSFNTCISAFMICVNELSEQACHKRKILEPLVLLIAPFAPHIAEELWQQLRPDSKTISFETFPTHDEKYLQDSEFAYPVSVNGKVRQKITMDLSWDEEKVKECVLNDEKIKSFIEGKTLRKFIFVKGKIINIVV